MRNAISKGLPPALLAAAAMLIAGGAQAHAHLLKASPAADTAVAAPQKIQLQFSEALEPKFSGLELKTAAGAAVTMAAKVAKDRKTLDAAPGAPLAPGAYRVLWHVVSADGHKMKGDYGFTVK